MKETLVPHLRCVLCRQSLELGVSTRDAQEIMEGELRCMGCKKTYPVTRGVPRLLKHQIEPLRKHTAQRFGEEWIMFDDLGEGFERELLKEFIFPLEPTIFKNALVMEAGCGGGRNIRRIAEYGAREVIGVDLGPSVDVAFRKTRSLSNVHVIQADIYDIPLSNNFDIAFSAGVLHHLPDPHHGFQTVCAHARPGGLVVNTVYGQENNEWLEKFVTPIRLKMTQFIPPMGLAMLSYLIAIPAYLLLRLVYKPLNEIQATQRFASKLFYNDFGYVLVKLGFRSIVAQIYDQLTAPVAFFIPEKEVRNWVQQAGLENAKFHWRNRNCWNFSGLKPQ